MTRARWIEAWSRPPPTRHWPSFPWGSPCCRNPFRSSLVQVRGATIQVKGTCGVVPGAASAALTFTRRP